MRKNHSKIIYIKLVHLPFLSHVQLSPHQEMRTTCTHDHNSEVVCRSRFSVLTLMRHATCYWYCES